MNSMSDIVALKRVDMENIQRIGRPLVPITPRLVTWNVNNERPNVYFPNINRSYISDLTYIPGQFINRRSHYNSVNREASWTPYTSVKHQPLVECDNPEAEDEEEASLTNPLYHPQLRIPKPLGLLKKEYKHPLSMYEDVLSNKFSRYALKQSNFKLFNSGTQDPTLPQQYVSNLPQSVYWYAERPRNAGKEWVTNRWRMWSGGSASSPE
uniref:Uncharacterized LOC100183277 n=1 Tax=Ciona intestinalis TaxID=7719 RepID=A0A1W3JRD5_CIOIN|nr:uncharacterized protein LOC100183277 [Ciona intestinalis]|eukprot:XP_026692595.1 uncharacterized protein LOC100183277 [Ciona intestinalis]